MAYFPKSQIKTNLFTNGGEYIYFTTKLNYKGYYYQTSNGKKYTGKNPQDGPNLLIVPLNSIFNPEGESAIDDNVISYVFANVEDTIEDGNNFTYPNSFKTLPPRRLPLFTPTLPTSQDQSLGVFTRYFCKKNNELKYIEINKQTHDQLKARSPKLAWDLYTPLNILWLIKGTKEQVFKANKTNVNLVEQRQSWYGCSQYLKEDYLKYYLES